MLEKLASLHDPVTNGGRVRDRPGFGEGLGEKIRDRAGAGFAAGSRRDSRRVSTIGFAGARIRRDSIALAPPSAGAAGLRDRLRRGRLRGGLHGPGLCGFPPSRAPTSSWAPHSSPRQGRRRALGGEFFADFEVERCVASDVVLRIRRHPRRRAKGGPRHKAAPQTPVTRLIESRPHACAATARIYRMSTGSRASGAHRSVITTAPAHASARARQRGRSPGIERHADEVRPISAQEAVLRPPYRGSSREGDEQSIHHALRSASATSSARSDERAIVGSGSCPGKTRKARAERIVVRPMSGLSPIRVM